MQRRNFLKGALGAWAGITTLFSYKYFSEKQQKSERKLSNAEITSRSPENDKFYHVEFSICHHCNLNCAGCDHFAPLAPKYQMPVEVFEKDIKQLAKITNKNLQTIMLMGGEPLLHEKIEDLIKIARNNFPNSNISILTNGLLLDKKTEQFYKTCEDNKVTIAISNYIEYDKLVDFNFVNKMAKKYNLALRISNPKRQFGLLNISHKILNKNIAQKYKQCPEKINGALVDNGILYSCCIAQGMKDFFNATFKDKAIPFSPNDTLDIHKISSLDEISAFLNKPKSICTYCNYHDKNVKENKTHWHLSKKEASEWYMS